ncbi:MAG: hypothetical protein ACYC3G_01625, partial [Minisyncoccota bacterium]
KLIGFEEYVSHYNQSSYVLNSQKIDTASINLPAYILITNVMYDIPLGSGAGQAGGQLAKRSVLVEVGGIQDARALEFGLKNEADLGLIDKIFST